MDVLQVPFTSAALLLAIAGVQKLRDPHALARALRLAGLPDQTNVVRGLAMLEIATAAAAITIHHPLVPLLVALLYVSFAAFVTFALARGVPIESCGCFGRSDARPSAAHVALDAFAAAIATLVAMDNVAPLRALIADEPIQGGAVALAAILLASLTAAWMRGSRAARVHRVLR